MPMSESLNLAIAEKLMEAAVLLERQQANPFRVRAYRNAAATLQSLPRDVGRILDDEGIPGLIALPHIGEGIARIIYELVHSGRSAQLERLRGTLDPATLFQSVPGIGPALAERIHEHLHVDTLEELETAAHDGRLEGVGGLGPRRVAAIRANLGSMLGRVRRDRPPEAGPEPPVELLLDVDREYRDRAARDDLPTIAPRRFNPAHEAWLPILHCSRGEWHFTALFSNTARAHQLGREHDWVVIYFYDSDHRERQRTLVTETRGRLVGKRVVRGRERDCLAFYDREMEKARQTAQPAG